ncbi:MAG: type II secretion system F family protein [Solirubrobacteraceae bacterium]
MSLAALAGALVGFGLWLLARGVLPPQPSLAAALAALRTIPPARPLVTPLATQWSPLARLGAPLGRSLARQGGGRALGISDGVRRDLLVLGRSTEQHVAEKLATALLGLLLPSVVAALATAAGAPLSVGVPLLVGAGLAVAGFLLPDAAAHSEAEGRRLEFREALSVFVDLTSLGLAAGSGPEEAMAEAARVGRGWAFGQLRRALEVTTFSRETSWQALTRLGQELGVADLEEVASSIGLAEERGARVRESLAERAESMRRARLAEAEGRARRASQRMSLPVVLLLVAFIVFLAYPAVERIVAVGS